MKKSNNKALLISVLSAHGWTRNRWGHFEKTVNFKHPTTQIITPRKMRVKLMKLACRIEVLRDDLGSEARWFKRASSYYHKIVLQPDGRLRVGRLLIGRPSPITSKPERSETPSHPQVAPSLKDFLS